MTRRVAGRKPRIAAAEFDAWAEYYDLVHQGLPGELEFYISQALKRGGRTLELGCGTGRVALPMAMRGADVTGLDLSPRMLEICRYKLAEIGPIKGRIRIVQGDMADFRLEEQFRFVAIPYRSFMHLHQTAHQRGCLRAVYNHLEPGGACILNTWLPDPAYITARREMGEYALAGEYEPDEEGVTLRHYHRVRCDALRQKMSEEHLIEEFDGGGERISSVVLPLTRVWTSYREMEHLVRLTGFEVEAVLGDFEGGPVVEASTEMIWIIRRPDL